MLPLNLRAQPPWSHLSVNILPQLESHLALILPLCEQFFLPPSSPSLTTIQNESTIHISLLHTYMITK